MALTFLARSSLVLGLAQAIAASAMAQSIDVEGVRNKIRPCWFGPTAKPTSVALVVRMNRDATPAGVQVKGTERYRSDADFREAADRATRAIMNPHCHPWPLPAEKYDSWRTLTFNFDPRDY